MSIRSCTGLRPIDSLEGDHPYPRVCLPAVEVSFSRLYGAVPQFIESHRIYAPFFGRTFPCNFPQPLRLHAGDPHVSKLLEFKMSALVLTEMSAFELKAWLGLCLFASYATDIITATDTFSVLKLLAIVVTAVGLFMIARSEREHISYKKIAVPLFFYLLSKFGYGFIITASAPYISSYFALLFGLILLAAVLVPFVHPIRMIKDKPKGCAFVALTKIPNALGLVLENAVIATSMTNYSFIQPMIMVALFFIGLIRKESTKPLNIIGSIVCISGIAAFQIFGLI